MPESPAPSTAPITGNPAPVTAATSVSSSKPQRKMTKVAMALLVTSGVAFTGWVAFGVTAWNLSEVLSAADKSQTTAEGRIETLQSNSASLERDLDEMTEARDVFKDASDDVAALEKSVAERELAVTGREEASTAKETRI